MKTRIPTWSIFGILLPMAFNFLYFNYLLWPPSAIQIDSPEKRVVQAVETYHHSVSSGWKPLESFSSNRNNGLSFSDLCRSSRGPYFPIYSAIHGIQYAFFQCAFSRDVFSTDRGLHGISLNTAKELSSFLGSFNPTLRGVTEQPWYEIRIARYSGTTPVYRVALDGPRKPGSPDGHYKIYAEVLVQVSSSEKMEVLAHQIYNYDVNGLESLGALATWVTYLFSSILLAQLICRVLSR